MKVKQYIYHWLFFPLLAILLASGTTGCSNESVMEEGTSGKFTLSIMVRGITTTDPGSNGSYDNYVETLRVIGYDNTGTVVCNQKYSGAELGAVEGTDSNTYIEIIQTLEDAFQGGVCDFYFVANEDDYNVHDTQSTATTLSAFLNTESLTKDELMNCVIAYTGKEPGATNTLPILMTTSVRTTLRPGDNTINNIELVRCFAKVQLKIIDQTKSVNVVDNPVLKVTYPSYYSLWDESQDANWISNAPEKNIELTLEEGTIEQDNQFYLLFTSQEIYFPERLFDQDSKTEDNALKFSFTLNGTSYKAAVADAAGTDFNIRRNTHYTVIATLKKKNEVTLTVLINKWDKKTMGVEFN
jgi:hypothetical protein